jgi:diguanylate cyclase (GGDEF)-like protein
VSLLREASRVWLDRQRRTSVLLLSGVAGIVAFIWIVVSVAEPIGPQFLLWLPPPFSAFVAGVLCWQNARSDRLIPAARGFWRSLATSCFLITLGTLVGAVAALTGATPSADVPSVSLALYAVAIVVLLVRLLRLPAAAATGGRRLRIWLDAATVSLGVAVFVWHFAIRPALGDPARQQALWMMVLVLTAVFAVAKVAVASDGLIDRASVRLLGAALLAGGLGSAPQQLLFGNTRLNDVQYTVPFVLFFVTWAASRQLRAGPAKGFRQPFAMLPYGAVVMVDGLLLLLVLTASREDLRPVAIGAVVLTVLVVARQVTAYRENGRLLARLHHGATHDALTQLPNRAFFAERLSQALATEVVGRPLSVVLIDLDDFKGINDSLGHGVGDALLVEVGTRLAACAGSHDTVARLGGDEFVVVLEGMDPAGADLAVARLISTFAEPVVAVGHELLVSASVGIADGRAGDDAAELLRQADVAMYEAKRQGGASFAHFAPGMAEGPSDNAHLGAELRLALAAKDELFLLYQPIVKLEGGEVDGVEALARWSHPVRGLITPGEFIPVAERTGLVVPMGRWVLREAARQAAAWNAEFGDAAPRVMNVNVSARELRERDFPAFVASVLAESGLTPDRLVLEITETTVFALGASVANLHAVRALGVRIALDDFGTGQSTLTLLQDCPVDELKLDRSFTQADTTAARNTMAVAVIHLAHALGLGVVAEGVETPQQAERLRLLRYPVAQGFGLGMPMLASEIAEKVAIAR